MPIDELGIGADTVFEKFKVDGLVSVDQMYDVFLQFFDLVCK